MIDYHETKSQPISRAMVWQAYREVRSKQGSSGIDKMTWAQLEAHRGSELYKLWNRLTSGSYFPQPVKAVSIPKKGGGERKLGIPTVLDRIAQQVVRKELERYLEPRFHPSSFGYRPGRSAHDAVRQTASNVFNHDFVVDLDLERFFDTLDHELLLRALRHYCPLGWVRMYVERWLKAGVMEAGQFHATHRGTPQGGVISPLLANLYLHVAFDGWMAREHPEKPFERYADDVVVHCKTEKQAKYMLHCISKRMQECKLTLHPKKTKIVNLRGRAEVRYARSYNFLGFTVKPCYRIIQGKAMAMPGLFVSTESKARMREKFRTLGIHKWRKPLEEVAARLNPIIRGMFNYFQVSWEGMMCEIGHQLNVRLLKWAKWEKGLGLRAAARWLRKRYEQSPNLFVHWKLVHP